MRRWLEIHGVLTALGTAQVLYYARRLPERVASHFDGAGRPDGWMPRGTYLALEVALLAFLLAIFLGLPRLLHRVPPSLINLPNRDHWLAPERRSETLRALARSMAGLGAGTVAFLLFVFELSHRANLAPGGRLSSAIWAGLGLFLALTVVWLVALHRRFHVPRGD